MLTFALLIAALAGVRAGGGPVFTQGPDGSGKVGFTPPDLSDENTHSHFLPDRLRCEGCKAVAYQLFRAFRTTDRKRPSLRGRFPESLIFKVTDQVCEEKEAFEKYGLKTINDEQNLFGPGLDVPDDAPGVKQEGGMWPTRLRDMCTGFIDRLGDHELFKRYRTLNTLEDYTNSLCYGKGAQGTCAKQEKYRLPDKIRNDDVHRYEHSDSKSGDDVDMGDDGYYADDYEEDYDEDEYDDENEDLNEDEDEDWGEEEEEEHERFKRRAKRKKHNSA